MARAGTTKTFETPDGRPFWIRRIPPGKQMTGAAIAWPPQGWVCAPEGVEHDLNATRPTIADAIAHATGIGVDQPWIASISAELEQDAALR
jgi:hypothetical protein